MGQVNQEPLWQSKAAYAQPVYLQEWLFHKPSFVTKLKAHGVKNPQIIVLKQVFERPFDSERALLQLNQRENALIREVMIQSQEGVWMYARTIFPLKTLTGRERQFISLGNRSLGSILFKYPDLKRTDFEVALLSPQDRWYQTIQQWHVVHDESLWARRSLFKIRKKSILLSEVFLPDMGKLK